MTKQKRVILGVINSSYKHLSAEEIFFETRKLVPSISLSTVYRNLGQLVEEKMIRRIDINDSKSVYDKNVLYHAHAIRESNGEVIDIFSEELDRLVKSLVDEEVISYNVIIRIK